MATRTAVRERGGQMGARAPQLRRVAIESLMRERAEADISTLARHFGVSEMTIRRDLGALEADGIVRRLVGGRAAMVDPKNREPALSARATSELDSKAHIGRALADLIADNEVVYFDGGSTALAAARALRGSGKPLTILTRSLLIGAELAEEQNVEIFLLGGRLKRSEMITTSTTVVDELQDYNVDTYIMGISGLHPVRGLTDYDPDETASKRMAMERADRVLLGVDHSKIGRVLMSRVADVSDVDIIVTDAGPELESIKDVPSSVRVILVEASTAFARLG